MNKAETHPPLVVRTERGLTVGGTRLTIYQLMDDLRAGKSPALWQAWYRLAPEQIAEILRYLDDHRAVVEAEYEQVLRDAAANQQYWEDRNRGRMARIANAPLPPDRAALRAKLEALRKDCGGNHDQ